MLKKMTALMTGALIFLFAGCSSATPENAASEETTQEIEVQEVVSEDVQLEQNGAKLTFIGHAAIKLTASDGRVILIDPNVSSSTEYADPVDFILVTHGHEDHKPYYKVKLKEDGVKITWNEALVDGAYQRWEYDGIVIEAVPAGGNENHPIGSGVGYLVTVDGICVYHAGDSSNVEELHVLADKQIDYALYPIDGKYNMDAVEATELANIIGAKHNIPIHMYNDPGEDKSVNFTPEGRLVIPETESIMLEK